MGMWVLFSLLPVLPPNTCSNSTPHDAYDESQNTEKNTKKWIPPTG